MIPRSIEELTLRITSVLSHIDYTSEIMRIAQEKSPSAAFKLGYICAMCYNGNTLEALSSAKAARWLSVIRRDYGQEVFNKIIAVYERKEETS